MTDLANRLRKAKAMTTPHAELLREAVACLQAASSYPEPFVSGAAADWMKLVARINTALAAPPSAEGWIAVSERLPKPEEAVLIWSATHDFLGPSIGYLERGGAWIDEREWVGDEGWHSPQNVTHWTPLPAAPKDKP